MGAEELPEPARTALRGWRDTLAAHVIRDSDARRLGEELVREEGELARARAAMALGYRGADGALLPASSVKLGAMLLSEPDAALRRSAAVVAAASLCQTDAG